MDKGQQGQLRVYIRNILPVLLLAFGWYNVYSLARNLEKNVIETYQDAQLEVVRNAARAAVVYITHELERRGQDAIPEIERDVQREFASGREIADWTPVEIFDNKWVIGMSAMLPRIMENSGAYLQIQNAIVQMLVLTVLVFGLLYFLNRAEVQVEELRQRVEILQIEIDEAPKASQVSEIIDSEYFQNLAAHAKELRTRKKKGG